MNDPQLTCDPARIDRCLHDAMEDDERTAFEAHLEACASCRHALEAGAAAPADWQQAKEFLSSGELGKLTDIRHAGADDVDSTDRASISDVLAILGPTDDPHMLGRLGPYEVAGVVGRGGMGVVLKALDPALNRFVAIKVLAPQLATSGAARQRFAREARAAASVVHESVVAIHAVTDSGPLPYFVMPYLRGSSLQRRIDGDGPLSVVQILRVSIQIAAGLSAAHAQGLVHRDIKPANILLEDGVERLKITDFGLARAADDASLTRTGVIAGTPQFMSPEQARGELVDTRSDLFSLGSVMYAMCTARPPFRSETSYGMLQRICESQPRPIREINPDIPQWLANIIVRLHEKNPEERFQTAHELALVLEQCLAHVRQPDTVPLPPSVAASLVDANIAALPQRRAAWLSRLSPKSQRRAVSLILGTVALAVVICWFALPPATEIPSRVQPVAQAGPVAPIFTIDAHPGHPSSTAPLPAWDDDLTTELLQLNSDIRRLEQRLSNLEDSQPHKLQYPNAQPRTLDPTDIKEPKP